MWYNRDEKEYLSDNEMERKIYEWWENNYTEDDFENDLNDTNEDVLVCGSEYSQGFLFRRADPVAFRCAYLDELDFLASEDIHTMNGIFWKEDWCLGDEIRANMDEYIWKENEE